MATKSGDNPTEPTAIEIQPVGKDAAKQDAPKEDSSDDKDQGFISYVCVFGVFNHLRRLGVMCMWIPCVVMIIALVAYDKIFHEYKTYLCIGCIILLIVAIVDSKAHYDLSAQVEELKKQNEKYKGLNEEHKRENEKQAGENAKMAANNAAHEAQIKAMDEQLAKLAIFENEMNEICSATQRNMADVLGEMKTIYAQFYQMTQFNRAQMKNSEWHFLKSIYNKLEYAGDGEESFVVSEYKKFRREIPRKYKQHPSFENHFPKVADFEEKVGAMDDDEDGDPTKATQDNIYNRMENMFEQFWNDYEKQELVDKNEFMQKTEDIIAAVTNAKKKKEERERKEIDYANDNETRRGNEIAPASIAGMELGLSFTEYARVETMKAKKAEQEAAAHLDPVQE